MKIASNVAYDISHNPLLFGEIKPALQSGSFLNVHLCEFFSIIIKYLLFYI